VKKTTNSKLSLFISLHFSQYKPYAAHKHNWQYGRAIEKWFFNFLC